MEAPLTEAPLTDAPLPQPPLDQMHLPEPQTTEPPCPPSQTVSAEKRFWRGLGAGFLYLGIYFAVQLALSIPMGLLIAIGAVAQVGAGDAQALMEAILTRAEGSGELITAVCDLGLLGLLALLFWARKKPVFSSVGIAPVKWKTLWPLLPMGIGLNFLISSLLGLLPTEWVTAYSQSAQQLLAGGTGIWSFLILAVIAPVTEEVLFRGLIFDRFRRGMPVVVSAVLSSVLFGIMHGQILWMVYTALLGLLLCWVMERYHSILGNIALHMAFNAGSFLVLAAGNLPISFILPAAVAAVLAGFVWMKRLTAVPQS